MCSPRSTGTPSKSIAFATSNTITRASKYYMVIVEESDIYFLISVLLCVNFESEIGLWGSHLIFEL